MISNSPNFLNLPSHPASEYQCLFSTLLYIFFLGLKLFKKRTFFGMRGSKNAGVQSFSFFISRDFRYKITLTQMPVKFTPTHSFSFSLPLARANLHSNQIKMELINQFIQGFFSRELGRCLGEEKMRGERQQRAAKLGRVGRFLITLTLSTFNALLDNKPR